MLIRERAHLVRSPSSRIQLSCGYSTFRSATSCPPITSSDSLEGTHSVIIATRMPASGSISTGRFILRTNRQNTVGNSVV